MRYLICATSLLLSQLSLGYCLELPAYKMKIEASRPTTSRNVFVLAVETGNPLYSKIKAKDTVTTEICECSSGVGSSGTSFGDNILYKNQIWHSTILAFQDFHVMLQLSRDEHEAGYQLDFVNHNKWIFRDPNGYNALKLLAKNLTHSTHHFFKAAQLITFKDPDDLINFARQIEEQFGVIPNTQQKTISSDIASCLEKYKKSEPIGCWL